MASRAAVVAEQLASLSLASANQPPDISDNNDKPDDRLLRATIADRPDDVMHALASGATAIDEAMRCALEHRCRSALYMLLQRGALARTIGVLPSLLHRPGMELRARASAALLLLGYVAQHQPPAAYRAGVRDVLMASACLREGPLLLAELVRSGHLEAAFADVPVQTRNDALRDALRLNEKARRVSWSSNPTNDAVVCGLVRTSIRRKYLGYDFARQQLQLCLDCLHTTPWRPELHARYPPRFRQQAKALLLCAQRPPLCNVPECVVLLVLEHLAQSELWEAPDVDLDDGEEVDFHARCRGAPPPPKHSSQGGGGPGGPEAAAAAAVADGARAESQQAGASSSRGGGAATSAGASASAAAGGAAAAGATASATETATGNKPRRGKFWMQKTASYNTLD